MLVAGFVRFRYGDGFSHARAFALQLSLAAVPLVIAGAGLATSLGADKVAEVVARTVVAVSPGSSDSLLEQVLRGGGIERGAGTVVVVAGLVSAFIAASSAFAQFERGANRIYGVQRDRPAVHKYGRAALLASTAGVLMAAGLLFIVAGEPFGEAMQQTYHWGDTAEKVWDLARWPLGLGALVCAVTGLFRFCPRRRQPGLSWLAVGGVLTVATWLGVSGLLALYVVVTRGHGRHLWSAHGYDRPAAVGQRHGRRAAGRGCRCSAGGGGAGRAAGSAARRQRRRRYPRRPGTRPPGLNRGV